MNYADHVAAAAAAIPPFTSDQLRIIASNLAHTKAPRVSSCRTSAEGLSRTPEGIIYA